MRSSSCLYIGSPKSYSSISDPSEFLLTSIAFITVFMSFCSHAFLIQRDGKQIEIGKYLGLSSDQELLYLPLESLVEGRH